MNTTHFTLLRHGLPDLADHLLGRTDPALTRLGWQQMRSSTATLTWDIILSSPLRRCRDFAATLAAQNGQDLIIDPDWQELNFGDWDGELISRLYRANPKDSAKDSADLSAPLTENALNYFQYWQQPFRHTPPNGESSAQLLERVTSRIEQLSSQYAGKHLLIVTHSGVMRIVLAWLLSSREQGNPHLSRVRLDHAATLCFSTYRDQQDLLWPQLLGLCNSQPNPQHSPQPSTIDPRNKSNNGEVA